MRKNKLRYRRRKISPENKEKIKEWAKKITFAKKYELPKAKKRLEELIELNDLNNPELDDLQIELDEIHLRIKSINKVIRNLKREK